MSDDQPDGPRALLLGLDGVPFDVLTPMFEEGALPNLRSLFDAGVTCPLESQIPPWTPSAWPSLYTGTNPGKHGAFDFLAFDGYDADVVNRTHVREHALWELLDRRDFTSVVVNVPVTAPPRPIDGAVVPGYVGPDDPPCHPEGLLADLRAELGEYRVYKPDDLGDAERREWYDRLTRMRGGAFRYLCDRFEPDFGFLQFQQTDTVFHEMPEDEEAVRAVYEAVDEEVGKVVREVDPAAVVVASDHGIGPLAGHEFRVNEFLRDQGYVRATRGEGGMPSWTELKATGDDGGSVAHRLLSAAAAVGVTSQRIGAVLRRLGLAGFVLEHVSSDVVRAGSERVDFERSTAYMRSRTELGVRINLAGRDPEGTVSPAEYPAIRDDLMTALAGVETPEGDPVFSEVVPAEEYFEGPHVGEAVDVVTVPAGFDTYLTASLRGDWFAEPSEPWNHKRHGVLALVGVGVNAAEQLGEAHLFDVAPTVLSLLGVPPSDRMDGATLAPVEGVPPEEYAPFDPGPIRDGDDGDVARRLADLGYLDDANEY